MTVSKEEIAAAWAEFNAASRKVGQSLILKAGGAGAENAYSTAYQTLVRLGEVTQLRERYR